MTMYHMAAMPPQFGGGHPPPMHSSMFPGPLLPPINHNHSVHTFPPHSTGNSTTAETPASVMLHSSPIISQSSSFYSSHQPSVYINPYLSGHPQSPIQPANVIAHHGLHTGSHSHSHNLGYTPGNAGIPMVHVNHSDRQIIQDQALNFANNRRQPLSVDEELLQEMNTLHLGYLETEDSPHKMEQREKLESVIMEYLAITPHSHKFMFQQVPEVLRNSIMSKPNFSAHDAACAFDALAQYAANLVSQPWRREFREVKLHNGFWVHQVGSQLTGADSILELMGYVCISSKSGDTTSPSEPVTPVTRHSPEHYVLQGVIDPDLIARLALDCMIAYCECQCLNKIKEGVAEFGLSWGQILQYRQLYIGGVEVTLRHLLFTLRQCVNPPLPYSTPLSPDSALPTSPPPIPARQSSSFAATSSSAAYLPPSSKVSTPTTALQPHSPMEVKLEASVSFDDCHSKSSLHHSPDNQKSARSLSLSGAIPIASGSSCVPKQSLSKTNYIEDKADGGGHSSSSGSVRVASSSRVPTAKLIDLDTSSEAVPYYKSNHHLLPKVLPHKPSIKSVPHSNTNRCSLPNDHPECPPPPAQPPPEAFQAGTLEEHLEATLSLVKNPNKNTAQAARTSEGNSLDTWDFVFRGLEKKGYNKDIGDRGDILHDMARLKNNYTEASSGKNVNLNLNNQRKEAAKNRPLTINQALHQFNMHETTKERVDRPPSSKSSHSISHAYAHESHKRNSLYDNLSGGFETANQDSEGSEERRSLPLKKVPNASRQDLSQHRLGEGGNKNCDNISTSCSSHRSNGCSGSSSSSTKVSNLPAPKTKALPSEHSREKGSGGAGGMATWPCVTCTFENPSDVNICEMCGKSKDPGPEARPLESGGKQCPLCTLINERTADTCSACGVDLKGSSTYI